MTATLKFVDTPRGKISYLEAGEGPPLLLLQGLGPARRLGLPRLMHLPIGTGSSPGMPRATVTLTR